ncbi:MAG: tRNA 2-thiouridine(34) synthase MnmA [Deltaproteobacteria bacterium]|nr:tRNA 2-thiouridine(34) synthase MnmA [Deltaproteobacteria bacterium]
MSESQKVAVALSGGADSAVAAALLQDQGWEVVGVHLRLSGAQAPEHLPALARGLEIPLVEMDLRKEFTSRVVNYFVAEYSQGRTPNPCVRCNEVIKFGALGERLPELGADYLATGHYARLIRTAERKMGLFRGKDRHKDQSYFLARLSRGILPRLLFPLGGLTKARVKARYRELGLPRWEEYEESMEVCFIPRGDYREFLRDRQGCFGAPGELVDTRGRVLGRHRGVERYTVGQRRGLGVPSTEPYYVVEIRPETHRVVLGWREELLSAGLLAGEVNWLIEPPSGELEAAAVIRHRHPGVQARIIPLGDSRVRVVFAAPQAAVAPGQAVAFYEGDRVMGGGWIEARIK